MKICSKCGKKFENGKFCKSCGGTLVDEAEENTESKTVDIDMDKLDDYSIEELLSFEQINPNPDIEFELGCRYFDNEDYKNAFKWFLEAVKAEHPGAAYLAGEIARYDETYGYAVKRDDSLACRLFDIAKKGDVTEAFVQLGLLYLDGCGVAKDEEKAFSLFKQGAEKGCEYAMYNLGRCYENGEGTIENNFKAFEWYQKAVENGNNDAFVELGCCYLCGKGTEKNNSKAFELLKKAFDNEDYRSCGGLGMCYKNGWGTNVDKGNSFRVFKIGHEVNDIYCTFELGCCYYTGDGCDKNIDLAMSLVKKAADAGLEPAKDWLLHPSYRSMLDAVMNGATYGLWGLGKKLFGV